MARHTRKNDEQIIALLQAGNRLGMNVLFDRYYKPLVVFADDILRDIAESEDLVQEQLVKLWEKGLYKNIHTKALSTFLFTMVKNACINHLTKKGIKTQQLNILHYGIAQEEATALDDTMIKTILDAMEKLPEKTHLVVQSVMYRGLSYQETADELHISINTVKTLLKNGVKELRTNLEKYREMFFLFIRISLH